MAAKSAQPPGAASVPAPDDSKQQLAVSAVYTYADSMEHKLLAQESVMKSHAVHIDYTDNGSCDDDRLSVIAPPTPCTSVDTCPPPPPGESSHATAAAAVTSGVRVCAYCRTLKTPLWRNGPHGPKTLCNACGVRFKLGKLQLGANGELQAVQAPPVIVRARPSPPPPPTAAPTAVFVGTSRQQQRRMKLLAVAPLQKKPQPQVARTVKTEHAAALLLLALAGCSH